jgi:hypothetical protein
MMEMHGVGHYAQRAVAGKSNVYHGLSGFFGAEKMEWRVQESKF